MLVHCMSKVHLSFRAGLRGSDLMAPSATRATQVLQQHLQHSVHVTKRCVGLIADVTGDKHDVTALVKVWDLNTDFLSVWFLLTLIHTVLFSLSLNAVSLPSLIFSPFSLSLHKYWLLPLSLTDLFLSFYNPSFLCSSFLLLSSFNQLISFTISFFYPLCFIP